MARELLLQFTSVGIMNINLNDDIMILGKLRFIYMLQTVASDASVAILSPQNHFAALFFAFFNRANFAASFLNISRLSMCRWCDQHNISITLDGLQSLHYIFRFFSALAFFLPLPWRISAAISFESLWVLRLSFCLSFFFSFALSTVWFCCFASCVHDCDRLPAIKTK